MLDETGEPEKKPARTERGMLEEVLAIVRSLKLGHTYEPLSDIKATDLSVEEIVNIAVKKLNEQTGYLLNPSQLSILVRGLRHKAGGVDIANALKKNGMPTQDRAKLLSIVFDVAGPDFFR